MRCYIFEYFIRKTRQESKTDHKINFQYHVLKISILKIASIGRQLQNVNHSSLFKGRAVLTDPCGQGNRESNTPTILREGIVLNYYDLIPLDLERNGFRNNKQLSRKIRG